MKNLTHWIVALVPLVSAAGLAGPLSQGKQEQPPRPRAEKIDKTPAQRGRGEKQAQLRKAVPVSKTSLSEGIGLAEKETTGKAFSASFDLQQGKPVIQVNLFAGEKTVVAFVDPETKKVTIPPRKEPGPNGGQGGGGGGDDDGEEDG